MSETSGLTFDTFSLTISLKNETAISGDCGELVAKGSTVISIEQSKQFNFN